MSISRAFGTSLLAATVVSITIGSAPALAAPTEVAIGDDTVVTDASPVSLIFPLTRTGDTSFDTSVLFRTEDGSAAAGSDYTATSGTVMIPAGGTSASASATVASNTASGPDLDLQMVLAPGASFTVAENFPTGANLQKIASDDFNGDGRPDTALTSANANQVLVLLNTTAAGGSTASFGPPAGFGAGVQPHGVAAGDLNDDGRPDLAVTNRATSSVSVFLNTTAPLDSTVSFAAATNFNAGNDPLSVVIGDFDGDGRPDLAAANRLSEDVSVLRNTTASGAMTPSFAAADSFSAGSGPRSLTVDDLNDDGRLDLAVANGGDNNVSVLLNTTPTGSTVADFAPAADFGVGATPISVASGDFNDDGRPDLATANLSSNDVSVLLNITAAGASTASFSPAASFGTDRIPISIASGDFDGDGLPDLATANLVGNASVLINTGVSGATSADFATTANFDAESETRSIVIEDFNGDNQLDLAAANRSSSSISVLLNAQSDVSVSGSPATGTIKSPPNVSAINRAGANPSSAESVSWTVTFTEAVSGVDAGDFQLAVTGVSGAPAITDVSGSGDTWTVTASAGSGEGTLGLNLIDDDSITSNATGTPLANSGSGDFTGAVYTMNARIAVLNATPASVDFGEIDVGDSATALTTVLENSGDVDLDFGTLSISGSSAGDFSIDSDACSGQTLAPGATCNVAVSFSPSASGTRSGQLDIPSNDPNSPAAVQLTGTGLVPTVTLGNSSIDFGELASGDTATRSLTVSNSGAGDLVIDAVNVTGYYLAVTGGSCLALPSTLSQGESCELVVEYGPAPDSTTQGQLEIVSNAPSSPSTVTLRGQSVAVPIPTIGWPGLGVLSMVLMLCGLMGVRRQLT